MQVGDVNSPCFYKPFHLPICLCLYARGKEAEDAVTFIFSRKILITALFRLVREQVGDVNILVNNAGIMVKSLLLCCECIVFYFFVF